MICQCEWAESFQDKTHVEDLLSILFKECPSSNGYELFMTSLCHPPISLWNIWGFLVTWSAGGPVITIFFACQ